MKIEHSRIACVQCATFPIIFCHVEGDKSRMHESTRLEDLLARVKPMGRVSVTRMYYYVHGYWSYYFL